MHIPSQYGRKPRRCRNSLISGIAVPVSLEHHRRALDILLQPADRRRILRKILLKKCSCIQSLILRNLPDIPKPGMHGISEIAHGPEQYKKPHTWKDPDDLLSGYHQHTINPISHCHSEKDICLIRQLEHSIGSGISIFINIPHIYKLRDQNQSDST